MSKAQKQIKNAQRQNIRQQMQILTDTAQAPDRLQLMIQEYAGITTRIGDIEIAKHRQARLFETQLAPLIHAGDKLARQIVELRQISGIESPVLGQTQPAPAPAVEDGVPASVPAIVPSSAAA